MNRDLLMRVIKGVSFSHRYCQAVLGLVIAGLSAHAQSHTAQSDVTVASTAQPSPVAALPDSPGALLPSTQEQTQTPSPPPGQKQSGKPDAPKDPNTRQESTDHDEEEKQFESSTGEPVQTRRILGIVPNFQSVTADQKLPPQTVKQKFKIAARNSFDYSSFLLAGVQAGLAQNSKSYPEFRQGAIGYSRYYWHTLADTADENFMVGGLFPAAFHQDSRFYTLGHGSFLHRAEYASSRIFITRKDNGNETVNFSEIIGAGAASEISSLYYPVRYHTWTKVGQKWLTGALIDSANYTFKEFWPSINHKFVHQH